MAERITGRPWTAYEDLLLSRAVAEFEGEADWKTIAERVPGRTNKACRKRWLHSLSPSIKKSAWTREEDEKLLALYKLYGTKWSIIARQIPGRTDDACSKRYREALDPALKKDEWTEEEDAKLLELHTKLGGKWVQVGQHLQRSSLGCRNRSARCPSPVSFHA
ncbi:Homeodomain-like protein [Gloeopeniophorella convolvens]|nr:Homeodomain-like protein [Gloeopeniophorella convolvens]